MRAELLADGGAAARSERDFFRSAPFLEAEGAEHSVVIDGDGARLALPVIVREISGGERDAISPYGYPGGGLEGEPPDPEGIDWSATGLVSLFVRDRIAVEPCLAGGTERSVVQVHDPAEPSGIRQRLAEQIRASERAGWEVQRVAGPETSDRQRAAFASLYTETMTRAQAAARYFYDPGYFDAVLGFGRSWLLEARSGDGQVGAGAIAAISDGVLHYYLGGTADDALDTSPFKNVVAAMIGLADELEVLLNLGGGVSPGDGLESFKRGFANRELPFVTHEVVCDPEAYERLAAGRDAGGFFPAYRAG